LGEFWKCSPRAPRHTFLAVLSHLKTLDLPDYCPILSRIKFWWFSFFLNLKTDLRKLRYQFFPKTNFCPQKPGRRNSNIWLFAFGSFCDCVFGISPYLCVCVCLCICLCVCISVFFLYLSFLLFLIIFFCSLSLPADDDYHEFEPSGSKLNRSFLKWTRRARRVFGRISRISWLYFCISA